MFKFFQPPHNQVIFSVADDSPAAPFFMVDRVTGNISLKRSLLGRSDKMYEVTEK